MLKCFFRLNCELVYFKDIIVGGGLDGGVVMSVYKCKECGREKITEESR
jgi:hypothetical protein